MADKQPDPYMGIDKMLLNPRKQPTPPVAQAATPQEEQPKKERTRPTNQGTKKDSDHDSVIASYQDSTIDGIRKAVRVRGNEQSIHRLSREEKRAIKDLVYEYDRDGVRTSENELTRIALNWLMADHKERGKTS